MTQIVPVLPQGSPRKSAIGYVTRLWSTDDDLCIPDGPTYNHTHKQIKNHWAGIPNKHSYPKTNPTTHMSSSTFSLIFISSDPYPCGLPDAPCNLPDSLPHGAPKTWNSSRVISALLLLLMNMMMMMMVMMYSSWVVSPNSSSKLQRCDRSE